MPGIIVPNDRITTQPARGYCRNPPCRDRGELFTFQVNHDGFACPKCGADAPPMVGLFALTHLLIPQMGGPIRGLGGRCYRLACDGQRDYLATLTNQEAASGDPSVVDCPGCLAEAERLGIKHSVGWSYAGQPAQSGSTES